MLNLGDACNPLCHTHPFSVVSLPIACDVCGVGVDEPDWAAHKAGTLHIFNEQHAPHHMVNSSLLGGKGYQMMRKAGWADGMGLGVDSSGMQNPVKTVLKRDRYLCVCSWLLAWLGSFVVVSLSFIARGSEVWLGPGAFFGAWEQPCSVFSTSVTPTSSVSRFGR